MTPDEVESLVPLAAELVGAVRDYGPEITADVLARVPNGRHDALAVVLAAMVDPDARPSELLAWMCSPVVSREFAPSRFRDEAPDARNRRLSELRKCSDCGVLVTRRHMSRHRRRHVEKVA